MKQLEYCVCLIRIIVSSRAFSDIAMLNISVPFRGPPSYNPKRRSALGWLNRAPSMSTLALPPSPCPSDRSSAPFSSASSSLSDGSAPPGHETDTASIVTGTLCQKTLISILKICNSTILISIDYKF